MRTLTPDLMALRTLGGAATLGPGNIGVAAVAGTGAEHDVVTRFFAPGSGIPEDPTTGSLYCLLAPLFAARLGRDTLRFHQAYPGRGGDVECVQAGGGRVLIRGGAVTVLESRLRV